MLSWYRTQIGKHGFSSATRFFIKVVWARSVVLLGNKLLPPKVECPCCGWRGRRFLDYIEVGQTLRNAECPNCVSHPRHRAFSLWLNHEFHLDQKQGVALVFAPEKALAPLWTAARDLRVVRTDIDAARDVDLLSDVMRLPLADQSVKLIWCHHVLDQVIDDRVALREIFRVLQRTGGELVLSVGISDDQETREFGYSDPRSSGNRRRYGRDFVGRVEAAGFVVRPMIYAMEPAKRQLYGAGPETFFYCVRADYVSDSPATDVSYRR